MYNLVHQVNLLFLSRLSRFFVLILMKNPFRSSFQSLNMVITSELVNISRGQCILQNSSEKRKKGN